MIEALEAESETVVIHTEAVEDGSVEIADVDGVFEDVVGIVIGEAVADASLYSAAGDPCTEAAAVVIASCTDFSLAVNGAPEFSSPDDQRVF